MSENTIRLELSDVLLEALKQYTEKRKIKSTRAAARLFLAEYLADELGDATIALEGQPPKRGGWQGNEASIKALMDYADRVTDGGRNDPTESE